MQRLFRSAGVLLIWLLTNGCGEQDGTDSDPCSDVTCSGYGTCLVVRADNDYLYPLCDCSQGFHREGETTCVAEGDACDGVTCGGHGQCALLAGEPVCACDPHYVLDDDGDTCVPSVYLPDEEGLGTPGAEFAGTSCRCSGTGGTSINLFSIFTLGTWAVVGTACEVALQDEQHAMTLNADGTAVRPVSMLPQLGSEGRWTCADGVFRVVFPGIINRPGGGEVVDIIYLWPP